MQPSDHNDQVEVFLKLILPSINQACCRLFKDHLPGGNYSEMQKDPAAKEKLKSVPKTSSFAESVFGRLDQLLKCKPSITTIAAESFIMFSNNKTLEWLSIKT